MITKRILNKSFMKDPFHFKSSHDKSVFENDFRKKKFNIFNT